MDIDATPNDEYDSPWKDMLEHAFPEFMAFFFPQAWACIDWTQGHQFLVTELRQVVRDAELGRRHADVLVRVMLRDGREGWIYLHVEIQGQSEKDFGRRMFVYNYRLFDRFDRPVASFALLADDDETWRPDRWGYEVLGCRHTLEFPIVKLADYADRLDTLAEDSNPFGLIVAAHLHTRQTRRNPQARFAAKRALVRQLYRQGWERQRILDLFAVIDWLMRLPDGLERQLWQDIEQIEGEKQMRYITSIERLATERGMQQGMQKGMQQGMQQGMQAGEAASLRRLLVRRFGPLPMAVEDRIARADIAQIEAWLDQVLDAPDLAAVFEPTRH